MPTRPKHHERPSHLIEDLRLTIDCLPLRTREAMLEGVRSERIIVGAYVDQQGGVCPMMAAHRRGGRTDFLSFAKSWDRFTRAGRRSRGASERELSVLISHLEGSLIEEAGTDLKTAIEEHRELCSKRAPSRAYAGEADPRGRISLRRLARRKRELERV